MKYREGNFFTVPRILFRNYTMDSTDKGKENYLLQGAVWLMVVLCRFEHNFCQRNGTECFYRTDRDLVNDTGMSYNTLRKYKDELKQHPELVKICTEAFRTKRGYSETHSTHIFHNRSELL